MSKVLWEGIPNEGSKARKGAKKAMSLAFVLLPTLTAPTVPAACGAAEPAFKLFRLDQPSRVSLVVFGFVRIIYWVFV